MTAVNTLPTLLAIDDAIVQAKAAKKAAKELYNSLEELYDVLTEATNERELTEREHKAFGRLKHYVESFGDFVSTIV